MNKQDPQKLRQQRMRRETIRRFAMYGVLGLAVLLMTSVVVLITEGYYISPSQKHVIQNGLVLVDSLPRGAAVVINGREEKDRTQSRFTMPEGRYDITVWKTGYRDWKKSFGLSGSEVVDLNYLLLIPKTIPVKETTTFPGAVTAISQSPDQKWLVVKEKDSGPVIDVIDITRKEPIITKLTFSTTLFPASADLNSLRILAWASDNQHFLVSASINQKDHFFVMNRLKADDAIDVGSLFSIEPARVQFHDDKWDKLYVLDMNGDLRDADTASKVISAPRFQQVITYKAFGADKLLLVINDKTTDRANIQLVDKPGAVTLASTPKQAAGAFLLDLAEYDGDWYIVAGNKQDKVVNIYKNTFDQIKSRDATPPQPLAKLDIAKPETIGFSRSAQFIGIAGDGQVTVFDNEFNRTYHYATGLTFAQSTQKLDWVDGNHLLLRDSSKQYIVDYDGLNTQELGSYSTQGPLAFERSTEAFWGIDNSGTKLLRASLSIEPNAN